MAIAGLVITLSGDPAASEEAWRAMEGHELLSLGKPNGRKVPVVADAPSQEDDMAVWQWLNELNGVEYVDVVYVDVE